MKAVCIKETEGKPGQVYYPLKFVDVPKPALKDGEVLVKIFAAALNHRDVFIRQKLYPGIDFDCALLADGTGVVVDASNADLERKWRGKKVILTPARGWETSEDGPEGPYFTLGSAKPQPLGMLQEYIAVSAHEIELTPSHLSIPEAAAIPIAGLTAWRATFTKANVRSGQNVLITGIGGGCALFALQFAVSSGANVFVTSGSEEKLKKAKELGAAGGVNYKDNNWHKNLKEMLPKNRPYLDSVIDGAGSDIMMKSTLLLKHGGIVSCYGMTVAPKVIFPMQSVMKNIEMRGSTMGSRKEFSDMVKFIGERRVRPVVSDVSQGIDNSDEAFEIMKNGSQFGKIVIQIASESDSPKL